MLILVYEQIGWGSIEGFLHKAKKIEFFEGIEERMPEIAGMMKKKKKVNQSEQL